MDWICNQNRKYVFMFILEKSIYMSFIFEGEQGGAFRKRNAVYKTAKDIMKYLIIMLRILYNSIVQVCKISAFISSILILFNIIICDLSHFPS